MGLLAALVALLVARFALPGRVVLVHLADTGGSALAASRSDLLLVAGLVVAGLAVAWLVAAVLVLLTPARHLLVPHAEHWKAPGRRPVLRARLLHHVSLGVAVTWWSLALQLVAAVVAQRGGPLSAWWIPAALSAVTVLVLVGGGLFLLLTAWTPGARSRVDPVAAQEARRPRAPAAGADDRVPPPARTRTAPAVARAVAARAVAPRGEAAVRPARPTRTTGGRDTSSWNPEPPARGPASTGRAPTVRGTNGSRPTSSGAGGAAGEGSRRPARPYQPRPRRPGAGGTTSRGTGTDGRTPRG